MSATTELFVEKANIANAKLVVGDHTPALADGQVLLRVDRFSLTSNNLSYAAAGDMLGYWNFFPTDDPAFGRVPAWGYATVVETRSPHAEVGEEIFGYVPMGTHLVVQPADPTDLGFSDASAHRAPLHPWYNRYYRTAADPVRVDGHEDIQLVLWALFMTGWMLAREFADNQHFGAQQVFVASASSKTAYSLARSLSQLGGTHIIGLTSPGNVDFVDALGCYDEVQTYDALDVSSTQGPTAYVDMAGNPDVNLAVHEGLGDRLVQSIKVGSTHLGQRGIGGDVPGPQPRFFFIPDVAEARSAELGHAGYHAEFAAAWEPFATWAAGFTSIHASSGADAVLDAYRAAVAGHHNAAGGTILSWT